LKVCEKCVIQKVFFIGVVEMMEYLKRKFARLNSQNMGKIPFPHYYEENGKLIKELESGEKWEIRLDEKHREVLIERLK